MGDVKPTPGPWETHWTHDITGYPCFYIHGFSGNAKRDDETLDANAHLIAAAPELLAALRDGVDSVACQFNQADESIPKPGCSCGACEWAAQARAAIALAEGRTVAEREEA